MLVVLSHYGSNTASNSKAAPQKLKDALRDERLYGPSTSRDPDKRHSNFQPFKDLYFLIEELTGQYKPIVVKDISSKKAAPSSSRGPAYPEIQWQNSTGHCVFIPQAKATVNKHQAEDHVCSEKAKGKENQDIEDDDLETIDESSDGREPTANEWRSRLQELAKQPDFKLNPPLSGDERFDLNNLPSDEEELQAFIVYAAQKVEMYDKLRSAVIPNSTASGLVSGSVANLMPKRDMTKDPRLAHLGQRVMTLNEKGQVTKAGTVTATETKKRKVARPVPGKSFYRRPGYCENCAVKYDEFCQVSVLHPQESFQKKLNPRIIQTACSLSATQILGQKIPKL